MRGWWYACWCLFGPFLVVVFVVAVGD